MSLRKKLLDTFGAQVSSDHERYPADVKCLGFLYLYVGRYPRNNASRNTYAVAKLYAYWITINYREAYGMYACNGILFNHESPVRGETFVTRKITRALARIKLGLQDCLYLGNLDAKRDWGHARDYVQAQWLMLQQDHPEDLVIATGVQHSVRDFIDAAAGKLGMKIRWEGRGLEEKGYWERGSGEEEIGSESTSHSLLSTPHFPLPTAPIIAVDPRYFRPTEVETLLGDPTRARTLLGWTPKITFDELVAEMALADLESARRDELIETHGYKAMDHHE
ncbi:MAG: GDPmannose 4,6-dehydratase [Candidatus Kentron sp. G]|nr:MAG: GDPmannose 4,6-dehydratase [Candidatus Kentron sp. G]